MTPIPGNNAVLGIAKQSGKGTPNTTPTYALDYTGSPTLVPGVQLVTAEETDASAQAGVDYVVGTEPGGNAEHYLRPVSFALIAEALMGQKTGTDVQVATPSQTQPYFTLIEDRADGTLVTQFNDAKCGQVVITAQNRALCTYTATWQALSFIMGGSTLAVDAEDETILAWPQVTVSRGGVHQGTCQTINLTIDRNLTRVPGDVGYGNVDSVAGLFQVTGEMVVLFENDDDARAFATGTTSGTVSTPTLYTESLDLEIAFDSGLGVLFEMAAIQFTSYNVPVNTNAEPAYATINFKTVRQADIADNLTITTTTVVT